MLELIVNDGMENILSDKITFLICMNTLTLKHGETMQKDAIINI